MKIQTNKFIRDLLFVIRHIDSFFFSEFFILYTKKTILKIFKIIENFKHNVRMLKNAKSTFFNILLSRFTIQKNHTKIRTKNGTKIRSKIRTRFRTRKTKNHFFERKE